MSSSNRVLLVAAALVTTIGCAANPVARFSDNLTAKKEHHRQMAEERAKLADLRADVELACRAEQQRAEIERVKSCVGRTIPEIEANLGMRMRQRFDISAPELDVEEAKMFVDEAVRHYEYEMAIYREEMRAWEADRDNYYAMQHKQVTAGGIPMSGGMGCDIAGCDGPTRREKYSVPKPLKPTLSIAANEIPLKMNLRMATMFDNSSIGDISSRRVLVRPTKTHRCTKRRGCDCIACADSPSVPTGNMLEAIPELVDSGMIESASPEPEADSNARVAGVEGAETF